MVGNLFDKLRGDSTVVDPVCGMKVDVREPRGGTYEYEGTPYYFCGKGCRLEFEEDPAGYLSGPRKMQM